MATKHPVMYRPVVHKGEHSVTNEEFMEYFKPHFASQLRDYEKNPTQTIQKAQHIACSSMKIQRRYFCRTLSDLHVPLTPQQQSDMFIEIGLKMAIPAVKEALSNAGIGSSDINCIVFTSHSPFPFPAFTAHLMNSMEFAKDCSQVPIITMGCAGGGYALDATRTYLLAHPTHNVLVLCLELCSLGFRPHKSGMSWFINSVLFGDAVGAFVVQGGETVAESVSFSPQRVLELVHSKQRIVKGTMEVMYFNYDEWGFHFVTTQQVCDVCRENVPQFTRDLSQEAFGKDPKDLSLNVLHPGGPRIIDEVGAALELTGTPSSSLASTCMADGGNLASASVIYMMATSWDDIKEGDELVVVGMGPGFVMCGAAFRASHNGIGSELKFKEGILANCSLLFFGLKDRLSKMFA